MEERIQKILARMGIASRRKAEDLISEGRVTVNGAVATIGMKADATASHIKVDGKLITRSEPKVYFLFHKPAGVVTSLADPEGRPTVKDYFRGIRYRVFPVGRLDYDSEGLLLITNDGDLANAVMHPSRKIPKTYVVKVKGMMDDAGLEKLKRGVYLEDGRTQPARVRRVRETGANSWIEVTITEGRRRQVRRMMDAVGHTVLRLKRISINGLKLQALKPGDLKALTVRELSAIRKEAGLITETEKGR